MQRRRYDGALLFVIPQKRAGPRAEGGTVFLPARRPNESEEMSKCPRRNNKTPIQQSLTSAPHRMSKR